MAVRKKKQEYTEKISCFGGFFWEGGGGYEGILELQQYFSNIAGKFYWWEKHEYKNPVMKQDQNVQ